MAIYNTHNYDLTAAEVRTFTDAMRVDRELAVAQPNSHIVVCGGDWNYVADGESRLSIATPLDVSQRGKMSLSSASHRVHSGQHRDIWEATLHLFTELHQPLPTRYGFNALGLAKLDRLYTQVRVAGF